MEEITFEKNKAEVVKICLQDYRGSEVIDIRVWRIINGEEYRTRKGLTIRRELLPELISALEEALE
jgi:hypothetical protein